MKNNYLFALCAVAISICLATPVQSQTIYPDYVDGMVWVKLAPNAVQNQSASFISKEETDYRNIPVSQVPFLDQLAQSVDFTLVERPYHHVADFGLDRIYRLTFSDPAQIDYVIRELNALKAVEYAEKVELLRKTLTPNDPDFNMSDQWCLYQISAESAWNLGTGDANVVVAIVDDAVEITHSDLSSVIWTNSGEIASNGIDDDGNGYIDDVNGFDVANNDNDPNPDGAGYDHGTHVAGIAGAATNNSTGVASIGFGVSIMAVKSTNSATVVTNGYDGIVYAVLSGAHVINMSWGGSGSSSTAQSIIDFAYSNNIVCVAAAGNDDVTTQFYPAAYNNVISVASSTFGDAKSSFSNYGSWIDITAPGSAIWSTVPGNTYSFKQGTSMASPMVAGLAGLLLSLNPGLPPDDVETCIRSTADNIDGANPSYIGQLGDGRINALAAMNCVAATLAYPPVADFTADLTNIIEGQSVNFTDLSYYSPTTWSWTFTGGTPSSFNGQSPPAITYSTAGTYPVALTVTNANGNDTKTEVGYITVNALTGCDTISNTIPGDFIYTWTTGPLPDYGYIAGHNTYQSQRFADFYSGYGPTDLMGATFYFTVGETPNPAATVTITVWNDAAGVPGSVLYTEDVLLDDIEFNVTDPGPGYFYPTQVYFDSPVSVPTNFYVGYQINYAPGDSVACALTQDLVPSPGRPNTMFTYFPAGDPLGWGPGWVDMETLTGGARQWSMHIYPWMTDAPPEAVILSNSPVCEGEYMDFDGSTSPNTVNWDWAINGTGTPYQTGSNPSVIMSSAGTHTVYMAAYNYCGFWHVDSVDVVVNPTPNVGVTASTTLICPSGSANLTATGASSYSWSPATGLSCTLCSNPIASPSTSTTYTVTGTTGPCSADSYITIDVDDNPPTADFIQDADTICEGESVNYNGAISTNASSYDWTFTGGDISSSTNSNPSVTYNTAGNYTIDLTVENSCTQTDAVNGTIVVLTTAACTVGLDDYNELGGIKTYLNPIDEVINVQFETSISGFVTLELYSTTGQLVAIKTISGVSDNSTYQLEVGSLERAVYLFRVTSESAQFSTKFVIE